ncbi:hypothetical protein [Streptomyces nodosus]
MRTRFLILLAALAAVLLTSAPAARAGMDGAHTTYRAYGFDAAPPPR